LYCNITLCERTLIPAASRSRRDSLSVIVSSALSTANVAAESAGIPLTMHKECGLFRYSDAQGLVPHPSNGIASASAAAAT